MEEEMPLHTIAVAITYTALTLLGIFGNVTIVVIYVRWKTSFRLYKVTYIFLLSLTVANLFVSIGVMPLSIVSLIAGGWIFGKAVCTLNGFIFTWSATASILTILLISLHRATVVLSPLRRVIKTGTARIMAVNVWLISLVVPFPPLVGVSEYEYNPTRAFCRVRFVDSNKAGNIYSMVTVGLFVIVPIFIVVTLNIALYRVSVRLLQSEGHSRSRTSVTSSRSKLQNGAGRRISRTVRGELKAFTTVSLVCGVFVLCWAPQVILTMYGIISKKQYSSILHTLQAVCIFLNSAVNPYIYIYANKETRKRFMEMFSCRSAPHSKTPTKLNGARYPLVRPKSPGILTALSPGYHRSLARVAVGDHLTSDVESSDRLVTSRSSEQ